MTIGDVLAAIAIIFIVGASWTSAILLAALGLPKPVARAENNLLAAPGRCAALGSAAMLLFGLMTTMLLSAAPGPGKLLGGVMLGLLGLVAALGSGAIVQLLARRIDALGSPPPFSASWPPPYSSQRKSWPCWEC